MPVAALLLQRRNTLLRWVGSFGATGLFVYSLADASPMPLPGGAVDVLTIILAARDRQWWGLYAIMATLGSVVGGWTSWSVASSRGASYIMNRLHSSRMPALIAMVARWGWPAIFFGSMAPPPFPLTALLLAAGAAHMPRQKFLGALALGRSIRFTLVAWLAYRYGRKVVPWLRELQPTDRHLAIGLAVLLGVAALVIYGNRLRRHHRGAAPAAH